MSMFYITNRDCNMTSSNFLVLPGGCKGRGKGPNVATILDQLCRTCKAPRLEFQMPIHH